MKTVGEILKTAREEKGIILDKVVAATKIKRSFLEAIEKNDFQAFSSEVAARGFIKNYAEFLGLPSSSVLAIFRRDFKARRRKEPRSLKKPLDQPGFVWSPKLTLILAVGVVFLILVTYLGYQYFSLVRTPRLEVFEPQVDQEVLVSRLEVVGKADPNAVVAVNGKIASLSSEGQFSLALDLLPGKNKIVIEATSKLGKKTIVERTVFRLDEKDKR